MILTLASAIIGNHAITNLLLQVWKWALQKNRQFGVAECSIYKNIANKFLKSWMAIDLWCSKTSARVSL